MCKSWSSAKKIFGEPAGPGSQKQKNQKTQKKKKKHKNKQKQTNPDGNHNCAKKEWSYGGLCTILGH